MKAFFTIGCLGVATGAIMAACAGETEIVSMIALASSGGSDNTSSGAGGSVGPSSTSVTTGGGSQNPAGVGGNPTTGAGGAAGASTSGPTTGMGGVATTGGGNGGTGGGSTGGTGGVTTGTGGAAPDAGNNGPINVLVFNHTTGYGHQSRFTAIPLLQAQEAANNIKFDLTYAHLAPNPLPADSGINDESLKTPANLAAFVPGGLDKYDVVFFLNTTGSPFQGPEEAIHQKALQDYMDVHGGGFVGMHSATDTYQNWQWYSSLTSQYYAGHGGYVSGSVRWKDGVTHPILTTGTVPNPWTRTEEWYQFSIDPAGLQNFTVLLLATDPSNMNKERPSTWVHTIPASNGRLFYSAFGHDVAAFREPAVMKMLIQGIKWAAHRL
jgi:type 1 glutamine amidotransferase